MGFVLERLDQTDVVVVRASGSGSVEEALQILDGLALQTLVPTLRAVLFDLRELSYAPTPAESRRIAAAYGPFAAQRGCLFAFVAEPGFQFGVTRMVELQSQQYGAVVATFLRMEHAVRWLEGGTWPGGPRLSPGGGVPRPGAA
jgi:hypothetical protein